MSNRTDMLNKVFLLLFHVFKLSFFPPGFMVNSSDFSLRAIVFNHNFDHHCQDSGNKNSSQATKQGSTYGKGPKNLLPHRLGFCHTNNLHPVTHQPPTFQNTYILYRSHNKPHLRICFGKDDRCCMSGRDIKGHTHSMWYEWSNSGLAELSVIPDTLCCLQLTAPHTLLVSRSLFLSLLFSEHVNIQWCLSSLTLTVYRSLSASGLLKHWSKRTQFESNSIP